MREVWLLGCADGVVLNLNEEVGAERKIVKCAVTRKTNIAQVRLRAECDEPAAKKTIYLEILNYVDVRAALVTRDRIQPKEEAGDECTYEPKAAFLVEHWRVLLILCQTAGGGARAQHRAFVVDAFISQWILLFEE